MIQPALSLALAAAAAALPFVPGERMEFTVKYLGITMGKARISVGTPEGRVLPVFLEARTAGIAKVITVRDQLATFLDVETGLPRSSMLDAVESSYRHTDTAEFDREAGKATVRLKGKYDNTFLVDVPPDAVDFVALVFKLRVLPLETGAKHEFHVLAGRDLSRVVTEVTGREKVKTKAGEFAAVKIRVPTGFTGQFSEKNPTFVWLSDDPRRIVVRIATEFAVGHGTASLVSYQPGTPPS